MAIVKSVPQPTYTDPRTVRSPKEHWMLIDVLDDRGSGEHSIAIGEWDGTRVLAMRWNGEAGELGNPQSRGIPTWFIIPEVYNATLVETLPENKQIIAKALLGL
jgi:hypothetical protein